MNLQTFDPITSERNIESFAHQRVIQLDCLVGLCWYLKTITGYVVEPHQKKSYTDISKVSH